MARLRLRVFSPFSGWIVFNRRLRDACSESFVCCGADARTDQARCDVCAGHREPTVIARIGIVGVLLLISAGVIAKASRMEDVPPRESFSRFPLQVNSWRGEDNEPLTDEVLKVLGADDYLSRYYSDRSGALGLYVGYYKSQRQGDTMHSPLNCLPGAGWQPLEKSYLPIEISDANGQRSEITVNRYVIEKGLEQQVVLYWYQSHSRVIANEYRSKIFMVTMGTTEPIGSRAVRVTSPNSARGTRRLGRGG